MTVHLESKTKIGAVYKILGAVINFFFTVKLDDGIKGNSFKKSKFFF